MTTNAATRADSSWSDPLSWRSKARWHDDQGQTTAEYGLVLLAAATIAMLVVAWAGGTGAISSFFDAIIEKITSLIA